MVENKAKESKMNKAECRICGKEFEKKVYNQQCCSTECSHEKEKQKLREWKRKNPKKAREANRRWKRKNSEKVKEITRKWRNKNKEWHRDYSKRWRKRNPEKMKEIYRKQKERARNKSIENKPFCLFCRQNKVPLGRRDYCSGNCYYEAWKLAKFHVYRHMSSINDKIKSLKKKLYEIKSKPILNNEDEKKKRLYIMQINELVKEKNGLEER